MSSSRSSWPLWLSLLYFALSVASLVWPIYPAVANRIEPRLLGLPFSLVWILAVIASNFVVLALLYRAGVIDDMEDSEVSQ